MLKAEEVVEIIERENFPWPYEVRPSEGLVLFYCPHAQGNSFIELLKTLGYNFLRVVDPPPEA